MTVSHGPPCLDWPLDEPVRDHAAEFRQSMRRVLTVFAVIVMAVFL